LKKTQKKKKQKKHWAKFRAFFFLNRHIYQISSIGSPTNGIGFSLIFDFSISLATRYLAKSPFD
jgi:hypothetical protein